MKRLLIAGAALLAATSLSTAADLPPVEPAPVVDEFTWTGFYIGMHGGWAWAESSVSLDDVDLVDFDADNFVIGGQIGYNWQWDNWLFGIEGDGSFANIDDEDDILLLSIDHGFLASARGRLGLAFDRFLVFGTGGAAWAGFSIDDDLLLEDDDTTFFGWAAGGGIEYAFNENISIGVEYLHYEFDNEDFDFTAFPGLEADLSVDVVRGRLNVKFDSIFD